MKYDIFITYSTKTKDESEENKVVEVTTKNRLQKIEQKDLAEKITELLSVVPEDASNVYLEVHKNWDSDMDSMSY